MSVHLENMLRESGFQTASIALVLNLIQSYGNRLTEKPLVVFDCDQTLIQGDLGEVLLKHMWSMQLVKNVGEYEKQAILSVCHDDPELGQRVLETYAYALTQSDRHFGYLWDLYLYICQQKIEMGYLFAAACITQIPESQRTDFCRSFLVSVQKQGQIFSSLKSTYFGLAQIEEVIELSVNDLQDPDFWVRFQTPREIWCAVQPYLAQKTLVSILQQSQIDVAIISSSNLDMVMLMGEYFEIPRDLCLAVTFEGNTVVEPIPIDQGKIVTCMHFLGRLPILMVGDSAYDLPLMQKSQFGLLIDYQKEKVRMKAVEMGAVLQDFKSLIC
jgi:phosphoserine phosphatase